MSLTVVTPPPDDRFDFKYSHESSPRPQPSTARQYSHIHDRAHPSPHGRNSKDRDMSTHHRGLPPPSAMALPDPRRPSIPPALPSSFNQMPGHGSAQYQQHDDHSRDIQTQARIEEDKKRQEEQKTRQEELRLEQRRIEEHMLLESFSRGVPVHLIPMIFAGMGSGNLSHAAFDMAQQYLASLQSAVPQPIPPQDRGRDPNGMVQPAYVPSQHAPSTAGHTPQISTVYPSPAYNTSPPSQNQGKGFVQTSRHPPQVPGGGLPKLTTNEAQVAGPVPSYGQHQTSHPASQEATAGQSNIFFHHWQPPNTQSNQSSGKDGHKTTPNSSGNLSGDSTSPKKRKAQGPHEAAPIPSSAPRTSSPAPSIGSATSTRRPGHLKDESITSIKASDVSAPATIREQSTHSSQEEEKDSPKKTPTGRFISAETREAPLPVATES